MLSAQNGIKELRNQVDTLLIIPNEKTQFNLPGRYNRR
ncbi:MAG: hypothetical protein CM1200mP37_4990 [Chloroflexota bacterium]|nr:MAG: hypothetical protein CM1200mP37_4990 [Chloroflexota bacterium]